eukprot:s1903_g7.t1
MKGPTKEDQECRTHLTKNLTNLKSIKKYQRRVLQVTGASFSLKASVAAQVLHAIASVIGGPSREHQCRLVLLFSALAVMKSIRDTCEQLLVPGSQGRSNEPHSGEDGCRSTIPNKGEGLTTREPRRQQPNCGIGCFPSSV